MTMISANLWHIQSTYWAHFRKFHIRMHLLKKQANLCEISIASLLLTPELSSVKLFYDFWFHKTSFIRENFGKAGTAQREGLGGGGGFPPPPPPPPLENLLRGPCKVNFVDKLPIPFYFSEPCTPNPDQYQWLAGNRLSYKTTVQFNKKNPYITRHCYVVTLLRYNWKSLVVR